MVAVVEVVVVVVDSWLVNATFCISVSVFKKCWCLYMLVVELE